jgi:predicted RND superfamily exporter protein
VSERIAHFIVHRRRLLLLGALSLVVICLVSIGFLLRFNSDILQLLPGRFASVQGLRVLDAEFTQARELTFVLYDESGGLDLESFAAEFATQLRAEPWIVRVLDRPPSEGSPEGIDDVTVPLLLNLPPDQFANAMALLQPERIRERLARFRREIEAGSPRAEIQLSLDPLGLVVEAMKPVATTFSFEQQEPLVSPDGRTRLVLAVTNQPTLGVPDCRETMRKVADFQQRLLSSWHGPAPKIMVTGRTAYVEEMSSGMHSDIASTLGSSLLLVGLTFYAGFRQIRPLFAIAHVLLLACLVAVALGGLIFHELNLITIGLCSILVGLGVDFGMVIYSIYRESRANGATHERAIAESLKEHGAAIVFGALTTAAAFAALLRSDSAGFAQLGLLIALGILAAALLMMTLFFALLRDRPVSPRRESRSPFSTATAFIRSRPRIVTLCGLLALIGAALPLLLSPERLAIDANPRSLEPPGSKAGTALRHITANLPVAAVEPVILIVNTHEAGEFASTMTQLHERLTTARDRGSIANFSSPAAFVLDPTRVEQNWRSLQKMDFEMTASVLRQEIEGADMNVAAFEPAFAVLSSLEQRAQAPQPPPVHWHDWLPDNSPWWFVMERFFSDRPGIGAAYITPLEKLRTKREQSAIANAIQTSDLPVLISGWSYTLADLQAWSKGKVLELTLLMIAFNVALLSILFRRWRPVLLLMTALALAVAALMGTLALCGIRLNLFNVLAFPLVLGVGIDYAIYIALAVPTPHRIPIVLRPVLLSALTTIAGFGSLAFAHNPSLSGLGVVCAIGVAWCLFATLFFVLPVLLWKGAQ